jgi:hypothetical protein
MRVSGKGLTNTAHGKRFGIQDFTGPIFPRRHPTGTIGHAAVGNGGAILDDQYPLAANLIRLLHADLKI